MNIREIPDILTIDQCDAAIAEALLKRYTPVNCAQIADLYRTRSRLWNELIVASPMMAMYFQQAALECAFHADKNALSWDHRAGRK